MSKSKFSKVILSTIIASIFLLPQLSFAIGQMTKPIVLENVLRGQEVIETLYLFNSGGKEVIYQLKADGQIADWPSFYKFEDKNLENPITEIQIPAQSRLEIIVKFAIPKDTANGTYNGVVVIIEMPEAEEEKKGISAAVGASIGREVSITVTDKEILKFETTIIPEKYGVGKGEPLKIKVIYNNQGNVSIKPNLHLKITQLNTGKVVHNAIYPYPEDEKPVKPFERKEFPSLIEWQTAGQENGKYKAEIKVLLNGKLIEEESFRFDIGIDIAKLLLGAIGFLGGGNLILGWFVIGGIVLIIAGILSLFSKKPQLLKTSIEKIKSLL